MTDDVSVLSPNTAYASLQPLPRSFSPSSAGVDTIMTDVLHGHHPEQSLSPFYIYSADTNIAFFYSFLCSYSRKYITRYVYTFAHPVLCQSDTRLPSDSCIAQADGLCKIFVRNAKKVEGGMQGDAWRCVFLEGAGARAMRSGGQGQEDSMSGSEYFCVQARGEGHVHTCVYRSKTTPIGTHIHASILRVTHRYTDKLICALGPPATSIQFKRP